MLTSASTARGGREATLGEASLSKALAGARLLGFEGRTRRAKPAFVGQSPPKFGTITTSITYVVGGSAVALQPGIVVDPLPAGGGGPGDVIPSPAVGPLLTGGAGLATDQVFDTVGAPVGNPEPTVADVQTW